MKSTIHIQNASFAYSKQMVYANLNLELPIGKWTGLLGPSGIGKSSLLRTIAGLHSSQEMIQGKIEINNNIPIHQQIAYMAQTDLLLPWFTALENAMLGLTLRSDRKHPSLRKKAISLFEQVGLAHVLHTYPKALSGGMRQRVALIRTLMEDQPIVLMDEPFSALDVITRYKLQELAIELLKEKTVLFITHDPHEALRLAHVIYVMQGNPATLKQIPTPTSLPPRTLDNPEVLILQTLLFNELSKAHELS